MQILNRAPYLWIAALSILAYLPSLSFGFVYFDDNLIILDQIYFLGDFSNVSRVFSEDVFRSASEAYYRPLLSLSLMLDAHIAGATPWMYHLSNLILHALAACLAFALFQRLGYSRDKSTAGALLFALLPVHTQAVAWIMGRNDTLLACFVLASFVCFVDYLGQRRRSSLALHLLLLFGALLTKESGLGVPIACFAFVAFSQRQALNRNFAVDLLPGWLGSILMWWLARDSAFRNPRDIATESFLENAPEAFIAAVQLSGKVLLPFNLSVLPTVSDTSLLLGLFALLATFAAIVSTPRDRRWVSAFALVWIFVFLAPTFVRTRTGGVQHYLEHRMYLPSIGFLLVFLESSLLRRFHFGNRRHALALCAVLALGAGIILTHSQNFKDRMRFWQSAASSSPSHPLAARNLGAMYFMVGRYAEAEEHSLRALELNPDEPMVHNNLGLIYAQRGDFDEAVAAFRREIDTNPAIADSYFNLAVLYLRSGGEVASGEHFRPALALLEETLRQNPNHIGALQLMGQLYTLLGEQERSEAIREELERRGL